MKNVFKIGLYVVFNFIVMFSRAQSPDWMWVHSDGSPGVDFGMDIASDQSGNIYSVGSFGAPSINFGSFTLTNQGYGDNFLVKYDSNGSVLWAKSSGGSQYEETSTVKVDHAGNVIVAGYFYSSSINIDGVVLNNSGDEDIFIAKFNSGGTLLWAKKFGGTMLDEPRQLEVDDNDNIYMAGSFASYSLNFGIAMLVTNGDYDAFLLKLNPSGDPVWVKQAGGNSRDQAYSVTYDHHGNIYCSGEYQSSSFDFGGGALTNQGTWDAYIVKFDTSGNYNWIESFGGPGYEMGRSLVCDSSGFVYMGG
ncbi:MAG TPA: SBBP repeat-containing protein, partial [Bacteroidia bacterium]|nr:SBBP repeat-containing protein [Bacteroidia bacterium]